MHLFFINDCVLLNVVADSTSWSSERSEWYGTFLERPHHHDVDAQSLESTLSTSEIVKGCVSALLTGKTSL